ncbi:MAG: hypothetical protein ABWY18_01205 [Tardiphaga sp.]
MSDREKARELMTIAAGMPPGQERDAKIKEAEQLSGRGRAAEWRDSSLRAPN